MPQQASGRPAANGGGVYTILVQGEVERYWEPELQLQLSYRQTEHGVHTVLMGQLPDQAALLGVLGRLAMWGYVIVQVRYDAAASARRDPGRHHCQP